jgi:hypothetical protein
MQALFDICQFARFSGYSGFECFDDELLSVNQGCHSSVSIFTYCSNARRWPEAELNRAATKRLVDSPVLAAISEISAAYLFQLPGCEPPLLSSKFQDGCVQLVTHSKVSLLN